MAHRLFLLAQVILTTQLLVKLSTETTCLWLQELLEQIQTGFSTMLVLELMAILLLVQTTFFLLKLLALVRKESLVLRELRVLLDLWALTVLKEPKELLGLRAHRVRKVL